MSDEIDADYSTGFTLYAARFQLNGNVFITDGSSDQVWSDPTLYDVPVIENGNGGHYVGDFDTSGNIAKGVYKVVVFLQTGGTPANGDPQIRTGTEYWDGTAENNTQTITSDLETVQSDITSLASEIVIIDSDIQVIKSDTEVILETVRRQLNELDLDETNA